MSAKEITVTEAAERLGVTPVWVRLLLREGELRGRKLNPQMWMVDARSVERMVKARGESNG